MSLKLVQTPSDDTYWNERMIALRLERALVKNRSRSVCPHAAQTDRAATLGSVFTQNASPYNLGGGLGSEVGQGLRT